MTSPQPIAITLSPAETKLDAHAFNLLSLTLAVVLSVHAEHLPHWLGATLALLLGLRWWQRRRHTGAAPAWLKLPLLGLLAYAVIFNYGSIMGREAGSALAVGLLVLKLLESETVRDARVGLSFACFALMAALLFNQGLAVTAIVALGLLPALTGLRALEPAQSPENLLRDLLPSLALLAAALPLALLAFVLAPRLSSPLWGSPNQGQARTGLSDRMSPGDFADLLLDDRPALRVDFGGPPPEPDLRYFRAYVMWHYDGRDWNFVDMPRAPAPVTVTDTISYHVSLEPNGQNVLPALDVPLGAPEHARLGAERELISHRAVNQTRSYSLQSALHYRLQPELPDWTRRQGLQLPAGFNPRTLALGASWRRRYGSDARAIVHAALSRFHNDGFSYSLAPAPLGRNAMDDFLFDTREGFCEQYASAFTVLMRAAGIPARVVTGYQGGYWSQLGNYLLVRQSDAHAWSEVWLAGRGWVRVDPTAAVRPERVSLGATAAAGDQLGWTQRSWLQGLRNRWDIVNRWWNQGVIGFDTLHQRGLLTSFGLRRVDPATLGMLLAVGSALFVGLALAWALQRQRIDDPLRTAMQRLERKLAGQGLTRRHSEGPRDYLRRAARAMPQQREELERLMRCYLELRYAHDTPPPELLHRFQRATRDFRARRMVK